MILPRPSSNWQPFRLWRLSFGSEATTNSTPRRRLTTRVQRPAGDDIMDRAGIDRVREIVAKRPHPAGPLERAVRLCRSTVEQFRQCPHTQPTPAVRNTGKCSLALIAEPSAGWQPSHSYRHYPVTPSLFRRRLTEARDKLQPDSQAVDRGLWRGTLPRPRAEAKRSRAPARCSFIEQLSGAPRR